MMRRSPRRRFERCRGKANQAGMLKILAGVLILLPSIAAAAAAETSVPKFDAAAAERFARLALACVDKEYPNHISHVPVSYTHLTLPTKRIV